MFAASFIVLVVRRRVRALATAASPLAPAAAGVLLATVAHGLVDVYWVRGTPVLGWLLVGMVVRGRSGGPCGAPARRRPDERSAGPRGRRRVPRAERARALSRRASARAAGDGRRQLILGRALPRSPAARSRLRRLRPQLGLRGGGQRGARASRRQRRRRAAPQPGRRD